MDQENKQSRDNISLSFDDEAFNNLWDDSQDACDSKPSESEQEACEEDPLSASSLGRALDWGELAKDEDLWSGLDKKIATQSLSLGTIGIALSSLESMAAGASKSDEHVDLSADIALLEQKVQEKIEEKQDALKDEAKAEPGEDGDKAEASESDAETSENDAKSGDDESGEDPNEVKAKSLLTDEETGEIQLSERARMGRFEPENEVETSDHELSKDTYYTDAECVTPDPERTRLRIIWCVAAVAGILLGTVIYFAFTLLNSEARINYTQAGMFQMSSGSYAHVYASSTTRQTVLCSDDRGIVFDQGNFVAEFWPEAGGCREIRLSKDGKIVWFLGESGDPRKDMLSYVRLEATQNAGDKTTGFNPVVLKKVMLEDRIGSGFDVSGDSVFYFAQAEGEKPELRQVAISNQQIAKVPLPEDALPCSGMKAHYYGYVSGDSVIIMDENKEIRASLATPKLGCSRDQVIACSIGAKHSWSVLCKESVIFGEGRTAQAPVQMDDEGIRNGSKPFVLLRNRKGTDLVTEDYWRYMDGNVDETLKLSHPLLSPFEFGARSGKAEKALYGTEGGLPVKISRASDSDGNAVAQVTPLATPDNVANLANLFVSNGSSALVVSEDVSQGEVKSRLSLWNLRSGVLQMVLPVDGRVIGMNVSPAGNVGFVLVKDASGQSLLWYDWVTGTGIGKTSLAVSAAEISDVVWSEDHQYAIVSYENGQRDLYALVNGEMQLSRSYDAGTVIAFAGNGLLWRVQDGQVMYERISDGALSVRNDAFEAYLEGFVVKGITVHPASNDVVFWGPNGMLDYNSESGKVMKVSGKAIAWATPDHLGKYVATSEGLLDLSIHSLMPLPIAENAGRMHWSGSNKYLLSADYSTRMNITNPVEEKVLRKGLGIKLYGANVGLHPSADYMLRDRTRLTSLELITEISHGLAVFGGNEMDNWCFKFEDGSLQGVGRKCRTPAHRSEEVQLPPIPEVDQNIAKKLDPLMAPATPKTFTRQPAVFSDEVKLSVTTVPDKLDLVFVAPMGELPKELDSENDILSPFESQVKRGTDVYRVDVASEGYEARSVEFKLDRAQVNLRIPLMRSGGSALTVKYMDSADGSDHSVAADFDIELRSAMVVSQKAIVKCLKRQPQKVLKLLVDGKGKLNLVADGLEDKEKACLEPVLSDLMNRSAAEMPGLSDVPMLRMDIQFP